MMGRWSLRLWGLLLGSLALIATPAASGGEFLPSERAFRVSAYRDGPVAIVRIDIANGYYVYRDLLEIASATAGVDLGAPVLPTGFMHTDDFFDAQHIYRNSVMIRVPVISPDPSRAFDISVELQGAADAGLVYPPRTSVARVGGAPTKNTASSSTDSMPEDCLAHRSYQSGGETVIAATNGCGQPIDANVCINIEGRQGPDRQGKEIPTAGTVAFSFFNPERRAYRYLTSYCKPSLTNEADKCPASCP
jgi:thiol:disulfide interchange protein